jgi:hypothetical protein
VGEAALTDQDLRLLEFLAEHRVGLESQLQVAAGVAPRALAPRLRVLESRGYLGRERIFAGHPAACWITRRGLGAIGSRLPAPRLDLKGYRHDIGLAWLWLAARDGAFGPLAAMQSEREMRSADRRGGRESRPSGVGIGGVGPGGREQLHYPDLLLRLAGGQNVAVELELTGKSVRRLERIMLGYAGDRRIDAVLYLVPNGPLGRRIETAARRAGIAELIQVQRLAPGSPHGAPQPSSASRGRSGAITTGSTGRAMREEHREPAR